MINDIREYYCNLTKLQKKKFEVILENLYFDSNELDVDEVLIVIKYLRLYAKIHTGRKYNQSTFELINELIKDDLFNAEYLINENLDALKDLFIPNIQIKQYNTSYSYLLDLFQRVLK